jgi:ribosomal protein S18 acetylase RimI-like enzyme
MTGMLIGSDAVVVGLCVLVASQLGASTLDPARESHERGGPNVPWWAYVLLMVVLNATSLLLEQVWARTVERRWNARCAASRLRHNTSDCVGFHLVRDLDADTKCQLAAFLREHVSLGSEQSVLQHVDGLYAIVLARRSGVISGVVGVQRLMWALRSAVERCEDAGGVDSLLSNWQRSSPPHVENADATWNARTLVVAPQFRRKCIGRHVMQCLLQAARHHGVFFVELHVDVDTVSAKHEWLCRFYERLGFCAVSRRPSDVHMVCLLNSTPQAVSVQTHT